MYAVTLVKGISLFMPGIVCGITMYMTVVLRISITLYIHNDTITDTNKSNNNGHGGK